MEVEGDAPRRLIGLIVTLIFLLAILSTGLFLLPGVLVREESEAEQLNKLINNDLEFKQNSTQTSYRPTRSVINENTILSKTIRVSSTNIQPKTILAGSYEPRLTWTATPATDLSPTPGPTLAPTFVAEKLQSQILSPLRLDVREKWIDVNLSSQTLIAFEGAAPVYKSAISSGTARHPTVAGQFRIWLRFESQTMDGRRLGYDYYLKGVPFVQYFFEDYALHGTYWHNNFGTPMSHGCVNLPTPAAEWLYNWADYGTLVNIHK